MPDPAELLLRRSWAGGSDDLRASAWDAFHSSANPDELATSLQGLALPDELKADLWDLKAGHLGGKAVSTEDFAPPKRNVSVGNVLWNAAKAIPSGIASTIKTAYEGQQPGDELLGPARVLAPLIRNAGEAHRAEAMKMLAAARAGQVSEALGHGAATLLPAAGPAAAAAGEDIGSGDPERIERGGGNALVLVGSALAPPVARAVGPRVAAPLASIGEQLASKGKAIATKAGPALGEAAKTAIVEGAGHALGLPPLVGTAARVLLKQALEKGRTAAPAVEAGTEAAAASPNAGGALVRDAAGAPVKASSIAQMLADSLEDIKGNPPPARVTLPPPAELPTGYTPRTTVPKPKATVGAAPKAEPAATVTPRKTASIGEKNYFLRKKPDAAVEEAAAEPTSEPAAHGPIDVADLPVSWRGRTGPTEPSSLAAADVVAFRQKMRESGISTAQAIRAVTQDKTMSPNMRLELISALKKAARKVS